MTAFDSNSQPVLVIGESLVDVILRDGEPPQTRVGGSPANVALGLARWGVPVRLHTALSRDEFGAMITEHLEASGVTVDKASYVLPRTSTATARVSPAGDSHYEFDVDWRVDHGVALGEESILHVGSIACFLEPGALQVRNAVRNRGRRRITFDPNIRPAVMVHWLDAVDIVEEIAAQSEIVKLSDEDAHWLFPRTTLNQVIESLLGFGAQTVAVTRGRGGAILASRDAQVTVDAPAVNVNDTFGAGDSFMAALIGALAEGSLRSDRGSLATIGHIAALAAAITVERSGANLPTRGETYAVLASEHHEEIRQ